MAKLTKKTLGKSFHHWYYGNLTCFSQEHMQTFGYLASMLPIVEELYPKKEEQAKAMHTYTAFFNTEPQLGALIVGITAAVSYTHLDVYKRQRPFRWDARWRR